MPETKLNIILETKLGIDPTTSNLINNNINQHWLLDETGVVLTETGYTGTIANDLWNPVSDTLDIDASGSSSLYWELDVDVLQTK